jgi:hypothetical protein
MNSTWVDMTADSILHAGEGYIWRTASYQYNSGSYTYSGYDIEFSVPALQTVNKNNIFANDNVVVALNEYQSEFPQNRSWNLVGNPYPCYFDTRAMDVTAPITVYNISNNNYTAYSPIDDNYILTPGEAFFIQRPLDQEDVVFVKEGRQVNHTAQSNVNYFASARQSDRTGERSVFNLVLSDGEQNDRTRFVINAGAKMDYEMQFDASKFMSSDAAMQLYTIEQGLRYAINERPLGTGEVALGAIFAQNGTYTITLDTRVDNEVWLIDRMTGQEVLLGEEGYTFDSETGTFDNRFVVRLGNGDVTGIKTKGISEGTSKIYNLNGIRVEQPTKGLYINNGKKVVVK